jgi:transcriptional regulator with XRE-family HTH domain
MSKNLGKILKHIRVFSKSTQEEVSLKVGVTRAHLSLIENGHKKPALDVLENYSKSFDISLSNIMLFAENYEEKISFKSLLKKSVTGTALKFLDWVCKDN